jgi:hypothetical protein
VPDGATDGTLVAEQCQVAEKVVAAIAEWQCSLEKATESSVSLHKHEFLVWHTEDEVCRVAKPML